MSDEEIFDDNFDQDQEDGQFGEEEESLEMKFSQAEAALYMDKDPNEASYLFYEVYCDSRSDNELKGKCLSAAADCISQVGETERIGACLSDILDALNDQIIDTNLCGKIIRIMRDNLMHNEEAYTAFLNQVMEIIDANNQLQLYIDLKLRQAELALKKAEYQQAQDYLNEARGYISIPPDPKDEKMCDFAFRILLFSIGICELSTKDEKQVFQYYDQIKNINHTSDDQQKAVLFKIEGQMALHDDDYLPAAEKFYQAFTLFEQARDQKLRCLPFFALSIMLLPPEAQIQRNDPRTLFASGQIIPYYNNPIVAPMKQLLDAYYKVDYLEFLTKLEFAKKYFQSDLADPQYTYDLLEICRKKLLRIYISKFCQAYRSLDFNYLATSIKCDVKEIRELICEMITNEELNAVLDNDIIYLKQYKPLSDELQNVAIIFDALKSTEKEYLLHQPYFSK